MIPCGSCGNPADVVFFPGNVSSGMPYCAVDLPNHLRDLVGTETVLSAYEVIRRFNEREAERTSSEESTKTSQKKKKTVESQIEDSSVEEVTTTKD